jgi:foldase protein PrsA
MEHMDKKDSINKAKASKKKKLIRTEREKNRIKIIVTVVIVLLAVLTYYFIDSGSYVATVDGRRISKSVYQFFLQQQLSATESEEGLTTQEEKDKFWTTIAEGQDPYETAKREALNYSKEFMIQYIKAQEMGLKIDSTIKEQVASMIASVKGQLTDRQFKETYKVTAAELQSIYEIYSVIENFKSRYLEEHFEAETYTDEQMEAEYNEDRKSYDNVDISYIILKKLSESSETLSEEEIAGKKEKAEEALSKIQQGEPIDDVIAEYTEVKDDPSETGTEQNDLGKGTITYSQTSMYQYYLELDALEWIFDHEPGDTGIIDGDYFIYVVKIEDRTTFDDVKDNVKSSMEYNAAQEFYNSALESWGLESKYNIIKNERVYDSISYR